MKVFDQLQPDNLSNLCLFGVIMFANIDYVGIVDYALKAVLGGLIWFGFKLLQDYYSPRMRNISRNNLNKKIQEQHKEK